MNAAQISNLLTTLLQAGGGIAAGYGVHAQSIYAAAAGLVIALVGWAMDHHSLATPTIPPPAAPAAPLAAKGAILFVCAGLIGASLSACSTSSVTTAYNVEKTADATVAAAYVAWQDYELTVPPSATIKAKVVAAFQAVQAAELVAIDATTAAANFSGTNAVANASLTNATAATTAAVTDLVNLLSTLGIKL
jgi:hypothetical protein